ncbi:hypothetical protein DTO013F2_9092 [Penicillium roqueforti]|nr:hypothetical protein DTO013F2_9092 [Penicillium roqueforti]
MTSPPTHEILDNLNNFLLNSIPSHTALSLSFSTLLHAHATGVTKKKNHEYAQGTDQNKKKTPPTSNSAHNTPHHRGLAGQP